MISNVYVRPDGGQLVELAKLLAAGQVSLHVAASYRIEEAARRELALRRERVLEMYRDGLCERKFRDRSLQEITEEERRWEFATTTAGMTPIQALALVRGFAKAIQESTPEAQREVVQRVFQRIAVTDDRVTDVDVYPVYAEALRWYWRPRADSGAQIPPVLVKYV